jgi:hypothetical protein
MTILKTASPKKVKLSSLKADRQKEHDGDWIPAVDIDPAIKWHVRSTNYAPFKTARDAKIEKLTRQADGEPLSDDAMAKMNGELAVEHLLLDWEGLVDDDDKDIPYSADMATEVLTDEAYRAVRNSVYFAATKVGRSEIKFVGDAVKN